VKPSMRSRIDIPVERLDPSLLPIKGHMGTGVKYSLTSRQPLPKVWVAPGPNYSLPAWGGSGHKTGFPKATPRKILPSPGPADYKLNPKSINSFGETTTRCAVREGGPRMLWEARNSPGPAYRPGLNGTIIPTPRWTIKDKLKDPPLEHTGEHTKQVSTLAGQKWTFSHAYRTPIFH
jgi:hypothetical protein